VNSTSASKTIDEIEIRTLRASVNKLCPILEKLLGHVGQLLQRIRHFPSNSCFAGRKVFGGVRIGETGSE
jgi:hypothetical protein